MKPLNLYEIETRVHELEKHPYFENASRHAQVAISDVNEIFIKKFNIGHFTGSFIITERYKPHPDTFTTVYELYYRVLYHKEEKILIVEEANPNGSNPKGKRLYNFSEFIYKYWNPEGLYALEGFLLSKI
jgi:hypothetical protein